MSNENGYTLTELAIALILLAIIFALAIPQFHIPGEDARTAEVKSNIHTIQIALERYAVDSGGIYPLILYGGDPSDTFTVNRNFRTIQKDEYEYSEFDGDVDVLLEFGYLAEYPTNPFQKKRNKKKYHKAVTQPAQYNLPQLDNRVAIWSNHSEPTHGDPDRSKQLVERKVGGIDGNLMWDVSEGQRHPPFPKYVDQDKYLNGPTNYYKYHNPTTPGHGILNFKENHLVYFLPGNFYYYATFNDPGGYTTQDNSESIRLTVPEVVGFNLAGYGRHTNPAQDVYNIFGDYPERSLLTLNDPKGYDLDQLKLDRNKIYVGPDGRNDGVVIVVQSGADRKRPSTLEMIELSLDN